MRDLRRFALIENLEDNRGGKTRNKDESKSEGDDIGGDKAGIHARLSGHDEDFGTGHHTNADPKRIFEIEVAKQGTGTGSDHFAQHSHDDPNKAKE